MHPDAIDGQVSERYRGEQAYCGALYSKYPWRYTNADPIRSDQINMICILGISLLLDLIITFRLVNYLRKSRTGFKR